MKSTVVDESQSSTTNNVLFQRLQLFFKTKKSLCREKFSNGNFSLISVILGTLTKVHYKVYYILIGTT